MNQQPPGPPQQPPHPPQLGQPYAPYPPPPPPKKSLGAGAIVAIVLGSIVGGFVLLIIVGALLSGTDTDDKAAPKNPAPAAPAPEKPQAAPAEPEPAKEEPALSQADQFKAFVAKNGTAGEKGAVKHVTKVQGADEQNDLLDTAEIHTDYTGGLLGPNSGKGKLLASAFADWKTSKNGLVTVYDADGDILANGNY